MRRYSRKNISEEEEVFDYRLSRVSLVTENSFAILATRWIIFLQPIQSNVETVNTIVRAAIWLHSFLRQANSATYCPKGFTNSYDSTDKSKRENGKEC